MQLKHVPFCFLIVASICLAGAVTASATSSGDAPRVSAPQSADLPLPHKAG